MFSRISLSLHAHTHTESQTYTIFWLYKNRCDFWIFCSSFFVADVECEITIWMKCRFRRTRFKQTKRTVNRILTNKNGPIISTRVCYSTFSLPETERDRIEKTFNKSGSPKCEIKTDYFLFQFRYLLCVWCYHSFGGLLRYQTICSACCFSYELHLLFRTPQPIG